MGCERKLERMWNELPFHKKILVGGGICIFITLLPLMWMIQYIWDLITTLWEIVKGESK
jgi:hypothetical protein